MDEISERLVREYVERHNAGVRTGDYQPLGELFASDAALQFEGINLGAFRGRDAIVEIFRTRGPDDELELTDLRTTPGAATAELRWKSAGGRAGTAHLEHDGARITRLRIVVA